MFVGKGLIVLILISHFPGLGTSSSPLSTRVTFDKLSHLSKPQFLHLKSKNMDASNGSDIYIPKGWLWHLPTQSMHILNSSYNQTIPSSLNVIQSLVSAHSEPLLYNRRYAWYKSGYVYGIRRMDFLREKIFKQKPLEKYKHGTFSLNWQK